MVHEPGINPNCEGSMTDNITGFRSISIMKPSATLDRVDVKGRCQGEDWDESLMMAVASKAAPH